MDFYRISMNNWERKDSFSCYFDTVPCTYSMTVNLDITSFLKKTKLAQIKFFPSFLYALTYTVNRYKEFRMDIDEDKNLGYYSYSNPYYTVFHEETETITNVWTEYSMTLRIFYKIIILICPNIGGIVKIQNRLSIIIFFMFHVFHGQVLLALI